MTSQRLPGSNPFRQNQVPVTPYVNKQPLGKTAPGQTLNPNAWNSPKNNGMAKGNKPGGGRQRFNSPAGYLDIAAGSTFVFGGNTYVSGGDGTMTSYYDSGYQGVSQARRGPRAAGPGRV